MIDALRDAGIGCSVHWRPLHLHPYYAELRRVAPRGSSRRDARVGESRQPPAVSRDDTGRDRNRDAHAACSSPGQRPRVRADCRGALMPGARGDAVARGPGRGLPRAADVALALAGLALALPVLMIAALAVALSSKGPVLFRQERVGRNGVRFLLLKLRTMRRNAAGPPITAGGDPRVTPVGRLLRRSKIDELPQLWHVLSGEMALVGPRPEVPEYVDLSDPGWRQVLEVRPGMTDPVSLRLRFEEDLLASVAGDRAGFYREVMVPFKVRKYLEYQLVRNALERPSGARSDASFGPFPRCRRALSARGHERGRRRLEIRVRTSFRHLRFFSCLKCHS